MGQEIHELRGVIGGDASGWLRAIGQAIRGADDFGRRWAQVANDVAEVGGRLAAGIAGAATAMASAVAVTGGKFNALKENANIAFSTILRDGAKARQFLGELQKFSQETPFTFGGLIKNSQYLLATGFALQEIIPTLRILGDTMSGLGKGEEELKLVAAALGQIRNSAKLSAADMAQLTNQGIPAWQMLAEAIGTTVGEARKMSESGAFSGQQAYEILLGGLQNKFGGGMAAAAGSFDQLVSNLKDTFDIRAGEITAPLFASLKNVFKMLLDYFGSGEFNQAVAVLADKFGQAGAAIEQFVGGNKEALIGTVTQAIGGLADGVQNLLQWSREAGPAITDMAQVIWSVVTAVGGFVAQYPQVLVALALWQGAQMIGAVTAARSLISAITGTISVVWNMISAFRSAMAPAQALAGQMSQTTSAAGGLKSAFSAGAASLIVAGFFAVLMIAAQQLQAELAETQKSMDKISNWQAEQVRKKMQAAGREDNHNARLAGSREAEEAAKEEVRDAERALRARESETSRIRKELNWTNGGIGAMLPEALGGFDPVKQAEKQEQDARDRLERAKQAAEEAAIQREAAERQARDALHGPAQPGGGLGAGAGGPMLGQPAQPEAEAADALDKATKDAEDKIRAAWERITDDVAKRTEDMALKFRDLATYMDPAQVQILADSMTRLNQAVMGGEISQDQYDRLVQGLNQVGNSSGDLTEKMQKLAAEGKISAEDVGALQAGLSNLMQQYQQGNITADGFARGINGLNDAMAAATSQAEAQARAEERKRLMSGQFTGDELRTAYEDRIIAFQRQRMQALVEQQFRQWQYANGFVDQTARSFSSLGQTMGRFSVGVQQATGYLNGMSGGGGAFAALNGLFSGQYDFALLYNELNQLKQILSLPNISSERRMQVEGRIGEIQSQLNAPPPPPMFVGMTGNGQIVDPGIQTQSARAQAMSITVSLPNLTRVSQSEAQMLVQALQSEMQRQGRRL